MKLTKLRDGVFMRERNRKFTIFYPIKKDPDKSYSFDNIHWFNLITGGSWNKLIMLIFLVCAILIVSFAYQSDIAAYESVYENPCKYCQKCAGTIYNVDDIFGNFNISEIEIKGVDTNGFSGETT